MKFLNLSKLSLRVILLCLATELSIQPHVSSPADTHSSSKFAGDQIVTALLQHPNIEADLLPDVDDLAKRIDEFCETSQLQDSEEKVAAALAKEIQLQKTCLFPVIVNELHKKRRLIMSGTVLRAPAEWNMYTLKAGLYKESLFASESPARVVSDFFLLERAFQMDLDVAMETFQSGGGRLPQNIVNIRASAGAPLMIARIANAAVYIHGLNTSDEIVTAARLKSAGWSCMAPFADKLDKLRSQFESRQPESIRMRELREVYEGVKSFDEMQNHNALDVPELVEYVVRHSAESRLQVVITPYEAFLRLHSRPFGTSFDLDEVQAVTAVAALSDIDAAIDALRSIDGENADFESVSDLNAAVKVGRKQLRALLGFLEKFEADDPVVAF